MFRHLYDNYVDYFYRITNIIDYREYYIFKFSILIYTVLTTINKNNRQQKCGHGLLQSKREISMS